MSVPETALLKILVEERSPHSSVAILEWMDAFELVKEHCGRYDGRVGRAKVVDPVEQGLQLLLDVLRRGGYEDLFTILEYRAIVSSKLSGDGTWFCVLKQDAVNRSYCLCGPRRAEDLRVRPGHDVIHDFLSSWVLR